MKDVNGKEIKVGQRVRVTYVVEGTVEVALPKSSDGSAWDLSIRRDNGRSIFLPTNDPECTVEVLAEPRIPEPKGLGAVVEASTTLRPGRSHFVQVMWDGSGSWFRSEGGGGWEWVKLIDPVLLSEGWTDGDA